MRRLALLALLAPLLGGDVTAGNRAYRAGNPRAAAAVYARLLAEGDSSAALRYNLGTALLRTGRWDEARTQLEAAAALPLPPELALRAHYNAGTADLLPVHRREASADERKERLTRAISRYKQALRIAPGDLDSKWNLELAQKLLDQEESGASDQPQGGGGGGGGGEDENDDPQPDPQPGPPTPAPQPQGNADAPQLSPAEAERVLSGAATRERETQRELLDRNRATPRPARDW